MKKHKVLWLSIAGIILVPALIVGGYTAYLALAPTKTEFQGTAHANKVLSQSSLTKDQFNELVQKHLANTNYAVKLSGNNVVASGTAMDGNVSAKLTMTPTVTKDGNVIMSVKKAVVNGTTVPGQVALGYLKKSQPCLPVWPFNLISLKLPLMWID